MLTREPEIAVPAELEISTWEDANPNVLPEEVGLRADVAKGLVSGTSTLGLGVLIERSCGFLANILAARFGGAQTFGAYALAISTANNVSTYAAGGIGSTAIRFSGEYQIGTAGYTALARALAVIASFSALLAACILWAGATPLSHLLHKPELTGVLRWSGCSAAAIIILECCRGFFVGQKRLKALLCLSGFAGVGLLTTLPLASSLGPRAMLISQSSVALGAVILCLFFYRSLRLASPVQIKSLPVRSLLKRIWSFSGMQIAGIISTNIAGWWLTTLVARSDATMAQMGFFAVAQQLRNMVALAPSLLIEGSFAEMTDSNDGPPKTPDQVTAICTYVATVVSLLLAGLGIIIVPWALTLIYGKAYVNASVVASIALATAVIHMGSGAASSRVSILSIRASVLVNTAWALFVGVAATIFLFRGADAAKGAAVYLGAHVLTAVLFFGFLKKRGHAPAGMVSVFSIGAACILTLLICSLVRGTSTQPAQFTITALLLCIWITGVVVLLQIGRRRRWLPSRALAMRLVEKIKVAIFGSPA